MLGDLWLDAAVSTRPSPRQLRWHRLEFYSFIHFGMNTFTDREWGDGAEAPALFAPSALDARQWVRTVQSAGMRGLILTCKHHDGFCLWPTKTTDHSVAASPWRGGQGDLVREVAEACREAGLAFGIYLSPWDRHEPSYGRTDDYNDFFVRQLEELLTGYGELFCVWFDGACGEGPNGKRQVYDWDRYYAAIRRHQPHAVISVCGPDVRWCGNEAGQCRTAEWSVVPASMLDNERIQEKSQQADDGLFASKVGSADEDLGSRDVLARAEALAWYPAEVNTSLRPGWFYHSQEDDKLRSLDALMEIYDASVGGNASFLLNLPPDRRGLIAEGDVARMAELGRALADRFSVNLAANAQAVAAEVPGFEASRALSPDTGTWWRGLPEVPAVFEIELAGAAAFDTVVLQEALTEGQRVEAYRIEVWTGSDWRLLYRGTVIGSKRIAKVSRTTATRLRLCFDSVRGYPTLAFLGVY